MSVFNGCRVLREGCVKELRGVVSGKRALSVSSTRFEESPFQKEKRWSTFLSAFANDKKPFPSFIKYNPATITWKDIKKWKDKEVEEHELLKQRFIPERHNILGYDLATAHFVVYRGGRVKFAGTDKWISKPEDVVICEDLPKKYVEGMFLEAIDASETNILYEGLVNFVNLSQLTWLSFSKCPHVDDWYVDRLSNLFKSTLQYLDLSDCPRVTERSLSCMYRFDCLKTLKLDNVINSKEFEFACVALEDAMPNLRIEGIKYLALEGTPD